MDDALVADGTDGETPEGDGAGEGQLQRDNRKLLAENKQLRGHMNEMLEKQFGLDDETKQLLAEVPWSHRYALAERLAGQKADGSGTPGATDQNGEESKPPGGDEPSRLSALTKTGGGTADQPSYSREEFEQIMRSDPSEGQRILASGRYKPNNPQVLQNRGPLSALGG